MQYFISGLQPYIYRETRPATDRRRKCPQYAVIVLGFCQSFIQLIVFSAAAYINRETRPATVEVEDVITVLG